MATGADGLMKQAGTRARRRGLAAASILAMVLLCGTGAILRAQIARPLLKPDECYRFAFGDWRPPLHPDHPAAAAQRVGRRGAADSTRQSDSTAAGRDSAGAAAAPADAPPDWAARLPTRVGASTAADSLLVLFPSWWPAGVGITWTSTRGDTLIGLAQAFVSDGRLTVPSTDARAIRIACRQ